MPGETPPPAGAESNALLGEARLCNRDLWEALDIESWGLLLISSSEKILLLEGSAFSC